MSSAHWHTAGKNLKSDASESRSCNTQDCGTGCVVSDWVEWSECTHRCGAGSQDRLRSITQEPEHGGPSCPHLNETRTCASQPCAIGTREQPARSCQEIQRSSNGLRSGFYWLTYSGTPYKAFCEFFSQGALLLHSGQELTQYVEQAVNGRESRRLLRIMLRNCLRHWCARHSDRSVCTGIPMQRLQMTSCQIW